MRRVLPSIAAVLALAFPAGALAADHAVAINSDGYDPTTVVLAPGDSVTFTNNTLLGAQSVQFDDETERRCGGLGTADCTRSFPAAGRFGFYEPGHCSSSADCADPAWHGVVIVDGPPGVTSISVTGGLRGQLLTFSGAAADPNGDSIASYNWDFGDGTGAVGPDATVQHAYAAAGRFTVTLTATDSRGNVSAPVQAAVDIAVPDTDADGIDDDLDRCATVPGPGPDGCPLVAPPVIPPLAVSSTAPRSLGLQAVLRSGIATVLTCSDTCTGVFTLSRLGRGARAAATGRPLVTRTVTINGPGSQLVTLKLSRSAKRSLGKRRKPTRLELRVVVTDVLGRTETDRTTMVLRPVKHIGRLPAVGISDQQATTFTDPLFQVLKLRYARLVTPWDSIFTEPSRLDAWLQAARAHGARPLVSFERSRGNECPRKPCRAPTKGQYSRAWKAFHKAYPWVRDISPWNEINSATQPTGKKPNLAAAYYNVVRASCRRCTIVAADLLDASNIRRYVAAFLKKVKGKPRLWGLHNYSDTNRFRSRGTQALLETVRGQVWLTETGGVVSFTTQDGKVALPKSERRAKKAIKYMFRLAERNARRIKRIYVYQWKINNPFDRFDAGVVRPDGTPRPSFDVLSLKAGIARRR